MVEPMLIGFAGHGVAGKTSAAALLCAASVTWEKVSFADPIKDCVCAFLKIDRHALDRLKRETPERYRHYMQVIGDHGRNIDPDGYVELARRRWRPARFCEGLAVVVDDVRLNAEAAAIRDDGGVIIHVTRRGLEANAGHVTDCGVLVRREDYILPNNGSPRDLEQRLLGLLVEIRQRRAA